MVVSGAEDAETEVTGVRYVGTVVVAEESIGVEGPARVSVGGMDESGGELRGGVVGPLSGADVGPELLLVEDDPRIGPMTVSMLAHDYDVELAVDAATGLDLPMGTGFDDFSALSGHDRLEGLARDAVRNRALLLGLMTACGWEHYGPEWWHYHLPGREAYPALSAADVPGGPMDGASEAGE